MYRRLSLVHWNSKTHNSDSRWVASTITTTTTTRLNSSRRIDHFPLFSSPQSGVTTPTTITAPEAATTTKTVSKRVWFSRLLLGISVFVIGYRWGSSTAFGTPSIGATTTTTTTTSSTSTTTAKVWILSSLLLGFILRDGWRMIPSWAKPSVVQRAWLDTRRLLGIVAESELAAQSSSSSSTAASSSSKEEDSNFADLGILARKLQGVWSVAERRLSSTTTISSSTSSKIQAAFLTLLLLLRQYKESYSQARDDSYAACGMAPVTEHDLQGFGLRLDQWMDLADAAYNEFPNDPTMTLPLYLDQYGFDLIKHDTTVLPGYLGHYVALHRRDKIALIGIKGTSSLEDLITDMCGATVETELEHGSFVPYGPTKIRAHEGILLSTQRLAKNLQPLVEQLLVPQGYQLILVGHSLGAAAAALLGVLLQSRIPELQQPLQETNNPLSDLPKQQHHRHHPSRVQVYAFASPPTLDLQSALACQSFVTTIVNNCDAIPRCNAGPILVTVELIKLIQNKMIRQQEQEDQPKQPTSKNKTSVIFRGRSRLSTLSKSISKALVLLTTTAKRWLRQACSTNADETTADSEQDLMTCQELEGTIHQALETVGFNQDDPNQLYVAGNVLLMYDLWQEQSKYNKQQQQHKSATDQEGSKKLEKQPPYDYSADQVVWAEPTAKVLRYLEFDGRMIQDHMAPSYKSSLKAICSSTIA